MGVEHLKVPESKEVAMKEFFLILLYAFLQKQYIHTTLLPRNYNYLPQ